MNKFDSFIQSTVMAEGAIVWAVRRLGYDNIKYKVANTHLQVNHYLHKLQYIHL